MTITRRTLLHSAGALALLPALARPAVIAQRVEVDLDRHVRPDGDELAALERHVAMRGQRLALARLQLVQPGEEAVQAPELRDQIDRALLADARHTRHVVAGIADERQDVHDL